MISKDAKIRSDKDFYSLKEKNKKEYFDYLYDQYSSILYGMAIRMIGSQEYAEEIVQQTYLKIWNSIEMYPAQKISFKIWIIQLLVETTRQFLDSKSIIYSLKFNNYFSFSFKFSQ